MDKMRAGFHGRDSAVAKHMSPGYRQGDNTNTAYTTTKFNSQQHYCIVLSWCCRRCVWSIQIDYTRPCRIASVYCETDYLGLLSEDGP